MRLRRRWQRAASDPQLGYLSEETRRANRENKPRGSLDVGQPTGGNNDDVEDVERLEEVAVRQRDKSRWLSKVWSMNPDNSIAVTFPRGRKAKMAGFGGIKYTAAMCSGSDVQGQ